MKIKLQSLVTRSQFENVATRHHPDLDGPVSYDKDVLAKGQKAKYPKDHISVHCVQRASRVLLMSCFGMLQEDQKMSNIFFHTDITLVDSLTLQGGEWPSVPWYPDPK